MKLTKKQKQTHVLRFDEGDSWPAEILKFAKKENIKGAWFSGFGAFKNPTLAFYDHKKDKYIKKKFSGVYEALSLMGNISLTKKGLVVHNHVVLGTEKYKTIGGHLISAEVGATLEVFFTKTPPLWRGIDSSGFGTLVI